MPKQIQELEAMIDKLEKLNAEYRKRLTLLREDIPVLKGGGYKNVCALSTIRLPSSETKLTLKDYYVRSLHHLKKTTTVPVEYSIANDMLVLLTKIGDTEFEKIQQEYQANEDRKLKAILGDGLIWFKTMENDVWKPLWRKRIMWAIKILLGRVRSLRVWAED